MIRSTQQAAVAPLVPDSKWLVCDGKKRYYYDEKARSIADQRSAIEGFPLYVYRCPRCGWLHLTKHPIHTYVKAATA